ncbi:MAG: hypothetical protein NC541_00210 [bacterium]|nr:hypothetical protein [bacterium]
MASYRGANNINLMSILKNFPYSLRQCYLEFISFFCDKKTFSNLEFIEVVLAGLALAYLSAIALQFFRLYRKSKLHAVLFLAGILLLPAASCFVLIIAVGNTMSVLMSMGLVMSIALLGIIVPKDGKIGFYLKRMYIFSLATFLWFQLSAVVNDQLALKEGKTATVTLTENIIARLYSEGYLDEYRTAAYLSADRQITTDLHKAPLIRWRMNTQCLDVGVPTREITGFPGTGFCQIFWGLI